MLLEQVVIEKVNYHKIVYVFSVMGALGIGEIFDKSPFRNTIQKT